jgi:hypothetical protein
MEEGPDEFDEILIIYGGNFLKLNYFGVAFSEITVYPQGQKS